MPNAKPSTLTAERLRSLLDYNAETGRFVCRVARGKCRPGDVVGSEDNRGYAVVGIDYRLHKAHRLAWLYVYGTWPSADIDHVNGDHADNRLCNLREATNAENQHNVVMAQTNSACGVRGVHWEPDRSKWRAQIMVNGRRHALGRFATQDEAVAAYWDAKERHHGGEEWYGQRLKGAQAP